MFHIAKNIKWNIDDGDISTYQFNPNSYNLINFPQNELIQSSITKEITEKFYKEDIDYSKSKDSESKFFQLKDL